MSWLKAFIRRVRDEDSLVPPKDTPLTDIPGKLLNAKSRVTESGRIEWTETKFNLEEYNRIKPIIDKWFKR